MKRMLQLLRTTLAGGLLFLVPIIVLVIILSVYFMTQDRIKTLELPAAGALKCLKRMGAGSNALLRGVSLGATTEK